MFFIWLPPVSGTNPVFLKFDYLSRQIIVPIAVTNFAFVLNMKCFCEVTKRGFGKLAVCVSLVGGRG
jgi:hypothetical protein